MLVKTLQDIEKLCEMILSHLGFPLDTDTPELFRKAAELGLTYTRDPISLALWKEVMADEVR